TTKKGRYNTPTRINMAIGVQTQNRPDLQYTNQISTSSVVDLETFLFEKGRYLSSETSSSRPFLSPVVEHLIAIRDGVGNVDSHRQAIDDLRELDARNDYEEYIYQEAINQYYNLSVDGGSHN